MKKLFFIVISASAFITSAFTNTALAGDAALGASVFRANCTSCHASGNNFIVSDKSLKKEILERYGMDSIEAIVAQITKGKKAMPAFKGRLTPQQIENVAAYVMEQSAKGWSR